MYELNRSKIIEFCNKMQIALKLKEFKEPEIEELLNNIKSKNIDQSIIDILNEFKEYL